MCQKNFLRKCVRKVSSGNVSEKFPQEMYQKNFLRKCVRKISSDNMSDKYPQEMCQKISSGNVSENFLRKCVRKISLGNVSEKCTQKMCQENLVKLLCYFQLCGYLRLCRRIDADRCSVPGDISIPERK